MKGKEGTVGIGGWMIIPILGMIAGNVMNVAILTSVYIPFFMHDGWSGITTPGSDLYHPLRAPVIVYEIIGNFVLISFSVVVLIFFFRKDFRFPRLIIVFLIAKLAFLITGLVNSGLTPVDEEWLDEREIRNLIAGIIATLIWVSYFKRSVRVKSTFVKGMPEKESE